GVWLARGDANVIALELQGMRAGSLPISARSLLERLTEAADRNNIKMTWYRHDGNPVALLRFQSDQPRPSVLVEHLTLGKGHLLVDGRSVASSGAVNPPAEK